MSRITEAFKNKPIFMPYFPLGYPDLNTSIDVIEASAKQRRGLDRGGAVLLRSARGWTCDPACDTDRVGKRNHGQEIARSREGIAGTRRGHSVDIDGLLQSHAGVWTGEICP